MNGFQSNLEKGLIIIIPYAYFIKGKKTKKRLRLDPTSNLAMSYFDLELVWMCV
jgi:hypothetical protein